MRHRQPVIFPALAADSDFQTELTLAISEDVLNKNILSPGRIAGLRRVDNPINPSAN